LITEKIDESKFECLLKEVTTKDDSLDVNDLLINEFYNLINQDCKRKRKSLLMLHSFILPLLIGRKSDPEKFSRLVKRTITPSKYMILPNHHENLKHWSFFIIDY
jgi:hypothetical protein